ncbi:hypothetical protein C8J57DRAFT_1275918 [Mycena rebaudengoi]|nr:hypothetical protein C8J57DRAFT_1275918 [Mycena rebaudengoi]
MAEVGWTRSTGASIRRHPRSTAGPPLGRYIMPLALTLALQKVVLRHKFSLAPAKHAVIIQVISAPRREHEKRVGPVTAEGDRLDCSRDRKDRLEHLLDEGGAIDRVAPKGAAFPFLPVGGRVPGHGEGLRRLVPVLVQRCWGGPGSPHGGLPSPVSLHFGSEHVQCYDFLRRSFRWCPHWMTSMPPSDS